MLQVDIQVVKKVLVVLVLRHLLNTAAGNCSHQEIREVLVFPGGVDMQISVCRFLMMVYPPLPSI